jgi:5-methylcytosine-specific restriction endonuclease McrA
MWPVDQSSVSIAAVITACAKQTRDKEIAQRLRASKSELERHSAALQALIRQDSLHSLQPSQYILVNLSDSEMKAFYTGQLSRLNSAARKLYDTIIESAPWGLCCYCQYGAADTLDHFVPKSVVAPLSLEPWNLVPACSRCNHRLRNQWGTNRRKQLFHPYNVPNIGRWLYAHVEERTPIVLSFRAKPPRNASAVTKERVQNEYKALMLAKLFSVVAAGDIAIVSKTLRRQFPTGGAREVKLHLQEISGDAFGTDKNSLRGVIYEALAADEWFCNGGYNAA